MRNYCIIVKEGGAIIKQRYVFTEWSSDPYQTIGKSSTHWKEREESVAPENTVHRAELCLYPVPGYSRHVPHDLIPHSDMDALFQEYN